MTRLLLPFSEFCRMTCTTILVRQSSPSHHHIQHHHFYRRVLSRMQGLETHVQHDGYYHPNRVQDYEDTHQDVRNLDRAIDSRLEKV